MAIDYLNNIDLHGNQILNVLAQILSSDPSNAEGKFYYNSGTKEFRFYNGTAWIELGRLDQITAPTAAVDMANQKLINLGNPTAGTDAVNKTYVDNLTAGLSWKTSVRVATTVAGTLASSFENGDTVDGVVLATGDRILIKDQAAGAENGIYTVNSSGAPTRATDADTSAEILKATVFVGEGTTNAESIWTLSTDAPITLGTTPLVFTQFAAGGLPTAGAGLTLSGSTLDVGAGTGVIVNPNDVAIDPAVVVRKFAANIGNGVLTQIDVTHNLGTKDVTTQIYDNTTPFAQVHPEVRHLDTNTVRLIFAIAPTNNQYRCVVHG